MAGDSGVIVAEIVNIAKKSVHERYPWVFLDIGKFGGLIETLDEAIKYPICFEGSGKAMRDHHRRPHLRLHGHPLREWTYTMPEARGSATGFTSSRRRLYAELSSVYFNGFPPLDVYVLD